MNNDEQTLILENAGLRARLEEAEETLRAIRSGEVDALVVDGESGARIFVLQSSDAESNRFRSDILAKVNDAVIAIDDSQHTIYLNPAAELQYGVTASDALGRRLHEIYAEHWAHPRDQADAAAALERDGQWIGKNIHVLRNGDAIHVESSVSRLRAKDGTPSGLLSVIRNVTDRSLAEKALRISEERYRLLFDTIEEGFCIVEMIYDRDDKPVDYRFLQVSPSFEKQTGLADVSGKCVRALIPDHEAYWFEIYDEVVKTGRSVRFEKQATGLSRWYDVCASRFGDPAKRQVAVLFNDITQRKVAEETSRRNQDLFGAIIDQAPGGVYVIDDQMKFHQVNANGRPVFANAEPVIGRDYETVMKILWGDEVGGNLNRRIRLTLETGESYVSAQFNATRTDLGVDQSYDWEVHRIILPNGRFGVVVYFTDTTERARAAEALRASEERANNVIQSITDGFITMDRDWRITYLSARGEEILSPLKKTRSNIIGKTLWEEFPHTLGTPVEQYYLTAMEKQVAVQFETYYPPLDRWFDLRAYPSATGMSLYFLDITERKQAEDALRESEHALRMADRSKDEFLAMLAHELRNPLAPLRNATEILQTPTAGEQERRHAQQLISRQIENMSRIIDDLLDVSRITEGKIELRKQPVALETVFLSAVNAARSSCVARGQELNATLPERPVLLEADPTRLEQILGNLLSNASKYSGHGSRISLAAELDPDIHPRQVIIRVADNGIGIDSEVLPRIFDLFVQSSRTLDRAQGGLGIGLTIVHRLVNLHGGSIQAYSAGPGKGTEFTIRLPVLPDDAAAVARTAVAADSQPSIRMLIVDDNHDSAETMAMLQELHGHRTLTAHTGPAALTAASGFRPDVVLLDIGLPEMDGFEVARRLRAMPETKEAFLIALTGYGTAEDRERAKAAGFDEHLAKPANLELLREWLRKRFGSPC